VTELVIAWTIRLSLLCFFSALIGWGVMRASRSHPRLLRVLWTTGLILFLLHVAAAFHFHHHWNHQAALDETASQTEELLGFRFGLGLYFNYLFLMIWGADVAWAWRSARPETFRWPRLVWIAYLVFIAFNGTVVFKTGWLRVAGISALLMLVAGLAYRRFIPFERDSS
jgi:hypothetical protein